MSQQTPSSSESVTAIHPELTGWSAEWRAHLASHSVSDVRRLGMVVLWLGGLLLAVRAFRIESPAFYQSVAPLVAGGAIISHLLPKRWRIGFFALLSFVAIWMVFGLREGTWLIGIGMVLVGLCHLPAPFWVRLTLLLGVGLTLGFARAGQLQVPWGGAAWPILGSMFMFRLIVYVYDLRHMKVRTSWSERFAYFFCLPNVAFPLFPVLDFATFRRSHYDRNALEIYDEGVRWIVRGLVHLVMYRMVYLFATISPAQVETTGDLMQYAVANYALYLRVSGQFHLIVGLLHLFGFRLPETHRFFYLASSFSDLWRRINIYWKDFMQKVVYMPTLFRLKRGHSETFSVIMATLLVFAVTWFMHSYQWFWLLGTWLWSATDALFWLFLATCLVANSVWELRRGRARMSLTPGVSLRLSVRHGVQTAGMFTLMCVLWTFWASPTIEGFTSMVGGARPRAIDAVWLLSGLSVVAAAGAWVHYRQRTIFSMARRNTTTALGAMFLLGVWGGTTGMAPASVRSVTSQLLDGKLNKRDADILQRGYYEKIVGVDRFNGELWRVYSGRPVGAEVFQTEQNMRNTSDARLDEVRPSLDIVFSDKPLTTNSLGMRDREYPVVKGAGVFRVAVLGQSYVLGSGVADDSTFDALIETRLRAERARPAGDIEFLNFGVPRYTPFQQLALLQSERVTQFSPDVVLLFGHPNEFLRSVNYIQEMQLAGRPLPSARADSLLTSLSLKPGQTRDALTRVLRPYIDTLVAMAYADIRAQILRHGAQPVFVYLPTPLDEHDPALARTLLAITRGVGIETIDLTDVYVGHDEESLIVADWDRHPNAKGHLLIAERVMKELRRRPALVGLGERASATSR